MIMDAGPKLLVLVIMATLLSACAAPSRMTRKPPPAPGPVSTVTPAASPRSAGASTGEKSVSKESAGTISSEKVVPEEGAAQRGVITTPLLAPVTAPAENVPPTQEQEETAAPTGVLPPQAAPMTQLAPAVRSAATPPKPMTVVADSVPREFTVTVGEKDPSHPYYGRGHDVGFIVDGVQGKELVLTRGVKYTFLVQTNVQHDFYFTTSPVGRGVGTVTDGIKGQFTYRGVVSFTPTASTPTVMYYECRNHPYMGGKIHIANAGEKVTIGGEPIDVPVVPAEQNVFTEAEVKQKLSYAEMVINSSAPMQRVEASDNVQAKRLAAQAKEQIGNAHSALAAGDTGAAMRAVDEALRLMSASTRMVPDQAGPDYYKVRYSDLVDQIHGFVGSYQRNLARGVKPKPGKELDKTQYDRLMREGEALAAKGQYEDAVKRLKSANDMLTAALAALLESQTVVYDKNFATPKEEYDYELARYGSYEDLIPLAIEQRKPTEEVTAMMDVLAKRAKEIRDEAVALAAKGDHKQAIMALQAATERLQKALGLAGVQ
jgi:tetratricopeptide (TPR) repeat protein